MHKGLALANSTNLRMLSDLRDVFRDGGAFPSLGQGTISLFLVANYWKTPGGDHEPMQHYAHYILSVQHPAVSGVMSKASRTLVR